MSPVLPVYELTIYEEDDSTPLITLGTATGHAQPYLKAPQGQVEQEVDFAKGAASIGQLNVQVVDVPTDPTDQNTGYLTGQLADASGYSQINGHRAKLTEDLGSGADIVLDGVVRSLRLLDSFVTYEIELRDIRERERKMKAFETTSTPTVIPRGVLAGYGVQVAGGYRHPVPATEPLAGVYEEGASTYGSVRLPIRVVTTGPVRDVMTHVAALAGTPGVFYFDQWKFIWRDLAIGGAYTEVEQIAHTHGSLPAGAAGGIGAAWDSRTGSIPYLRINNLIASDTLPADQQEIEFIIQYDGPVTEDWPLHLDGLTGGELLRNAYRGDYSVEDPRMRYEESAVLALNTPVRLRLKEPVDDFRAWSEKNIYPIEHAAPTLNSDGEVSPITYLLPDASVSLIALDDTNCRPAGGGWSQASEDAINVVRVKYKQDYRFSASDVDAVAAQARSDQVLERDLEAEFRIQDSIDLLGEQVLEIKTEALRAIGTADGGPLFGDIADETAVRVGDRITRMATDRFVLGGQYFALHGNRSVSVVEALKVGSWVSVGVSWMPDYVSGERGLNRLAQIISRRNLNGAWASLTLIDAGSSNVPLTAPTLGTVTAATDGIVSIPVTALGTGDPEARVDFAVSTLEPAADSSLWTFLGRVTSVPDTLTTPPLTPGGVVWVRARSEEVQERPSAYTAAVDVTVPSTPRVLEVGGTLDDDGVPTVTWVPNQFCLGVRIYYEVHPLTTLPSFATSVDVDATDLSAVLAIVADSPNTLSIQVEPYPGFSGGSVTGTPGPVVEAGLDGTALVALGFGEIGAGLFDDGVDLVFSPLTFTFTGNVNSTDHQINLSFFENGILLGTDFAVSIDVAQPYSSTLAGKGGASSGKLYHVTFAIVSKTTNKVVGSTASAFPVSSGSVLEGEILFPDSDIAQGEWVAIPLWSKIDAEDANQINTEEGSNQDVCPAQTELTCEVGLTDPSSTPADSSSQLMRLHGKAKKIGVDEAGGCVDFLLTLKDGTTEIATRELSDIGNVYETMNELLTAAEVAAITVGDHNDLGIEVRGDVGFPTEGQADVSIDVNYAWASYVALYHLKLSGGEYTLVPNVGEGNASIVTSGGEMIIQDSIEPEAALEVLSGEVTILVAPTV